MLPKYPYIPWCTSRTSFPEKHIKATGWTMLLSRMKTCVDLTCTKSDKKNCDELCLRIKLGPFSYFLYDVRAGRRKETLPNKNWGRVPILPRSSTLVPRALFYLPRERCPGDEICAPRHKLSPGHFSHYLFSATSLTRWEKVQNALNFVASNDFPRITPGYI